MKPTPDGIVTCDYGVPGSWAAGYHPGRDYRAAVGTPIQATMSGKVIYVGTQLWGDDYGGHIVIRTDGGRFFRRGRVLHHGYCHLSRFSVHEGERVRAGERIGWSGETGRTFGPHLHYEERLEPWRYNDRDRRPRYPGWSAEFIRKLIRQARKDHPKADR